MEFKPCALNTRFLIFKSTEDPCCLSSHNRIFEICEYCFHFFQYRAFLHLYQLFPGLCQSEAPHLLIIGLIHLHNGIPGIRIDLVCCIGSNGNLDYFRRRFFIFSAACDSSGRAHFPISI